MTMLPPQNKDTTEDLPNYADWALIWANSVASYSMHYKDTGKLIFKRSSHSSIMSLQNNLHKIIQIILNEKN